jgi:hypothetical protein
VASRNLRDLEHLNAYDQTFFHFLHFLQCDVLCFPSRANSWLRIIVAHPRGHAFGRVEGHTTSECPDRACRNYTFSGNVWLPSAILFRICAIRTRVRFWLVVAARIRDRPGRIYLYLRVREWRRQFGLLIDRYAT